MKYYVLGSNSIECVPGSLQGRTVVTKQLIGTRSMHSGSSENRRTISSDIAQSSGYFNKFTDTRQHNSYLLDHMGYMFRPVNRSSSGLRQNKSNVLFRKIGIPIFCTVVKKYKIWYWIKCDMYHILSSARFYICLQLYKILGSQFSNSTFDLFCWRPDNDLLTGRNM